MRDKMTLPPHWFQFEVTESGSDDCVQCYLEKVGKTYDIDISGPPPFRLPLCEDHRDKLAKKQLESISIGYVGSWGKSGHEYAVGMKSLGATYEAASIYKRVTDYVKQIFRRRKTN